MIAKFYRPGVPLSAFVECFWFFDDYVVEHDRERALPTGTTELVVSLGRNRIRIFRDEADAIGWHFRDAVVCGPHSHYFVLDTSQSGPVVGIHFRPAGATVFFGPAEELTNRHVALEDLWGSLAREVCLAQFCNHENEGKKVRTK